MNRSIPRISQSRVDDLERFHADFDPQLQGWHELARALGARPRGELVEFTFWLPQHSGFRGAPMLEILSPRSDPQLWFSPAGFEAERFLFELKGTGHSWWTALAGLGVGSRHGWGDLYRLHLPRGRRWVSAVDPLAGSLPFGSFGPAEIYSLTACQKDRADLAYLRRRSRETPPSRPTLVLEVHTQTATDGGTLGGLKRWIEESFQCPSGRGPIPPQDWLLRDFDGVQLMPLEPVAEPVGLASVWNEPPRTGPWRVRPDPPQIVNWGYDTLLAGFPAISPGLLEAGRPHEAVDLIAALHNLPQGGVRVFLDLVLGHAHRQAEKLLPPDYFAGPNRYGLNLNYSHPMVRAILLEMVRRKLMLGADGVRFDATQDIQVCDPATGIRRHDDEFLRELGRIEAEVGEIRFQPLRIFEDTRPWPARGWRKRAGFDSGLRDGSADLQWGPVSFPNFSRDLQTCRRSRRRPLLQTLERGADWISGRSTHDTYRQECRLWGLLPPQSSRISRSKLFDPPLALLLYTVLPGIPLEFLNALAEQPWGFFRNVDHHGSGQGRDIPGEWGFIRNCLAELEPREKELFSSLRKQGNGNARLLADLLRQASGSGDPPPSRGGSREPEERKKSIDTMWLRALQGFCTVKPGEEPEEAQRWLAGLRRIRIRKGWLARPLTASDRVWERASGRQDMLAVSRLSPDGERIFSVGVWDSPILRIGECMRQMGVDPGLEWKLLAASPGLSITGPIVELALDPGQALASRVRGTPDSRSRKSDDD